FLRRRPVRSYFQRPSTIATCLYSFRFLFLAPGHRRALHSFPTRRSSDLLHDRKLDALEDLIEAANGKPVLVMYNYQHDLTRIQQRFGKYSPENPNGVRELKTAGDMEDWNAGRIPVAATQPASTGHGLNLQQGGSTIVWFGLNWSLEL